MSKVLFLVNHDIVIYNFRLELVEKLLSEGHKVAVCSPYGERIDELVKLGVEYYDISINRHGINPVEEFKILLEYRKIIIKIHPDVIFGFTIKPNIYGAIAARKAKIPFVANITGLGTAVENQGWKQKLIIWLYKYAFKDIHKVFFQNNENMQFFADKKIAIGKYHLLPGSGVNLERFPLKKYPQSNTLKFAFISRIMKEKGIDQYLEAAQAIKKRYPNIEFHICGFCEPEYSGKLTDFNKNKIVIYHGLIRNISEFLENIHCVILPTYYPEGINNVLLEACSSGRPIITTNRSGCKEVIEDGVNGYIIKANDSKDLIEKIEKFINLPYIEKVNMGLAGRKKVENEFDRNIVVSNYMKIVNEEI